MNAIFRVGRYEALRPIASGGMATVYLGRGKGAHGFTRRVAIKMMHPHLAEDPKFLAMFLDEARVASGLHHPNVVQMLDVVEDKGKLLLVMDYIEGLSLSAMLDEIQSRELSLSLPIMLRIVLDLLAGLHAAHELTTDDGQPVNLVHRDVTPHNVLVGVDGASRLADFGIARAETRLIKSTGTRVRGKLPYMPPEQFQGKTLDRRVDIFAAGCVAWEAFTGRRLFNALNEGELVAQVLMGRIHPPSTLNIAISAPLDEVCLRALDREPAGRYPTAGAFAEALEQAAAASATAIAPAREVAALVRTLLSPPRKSLFSVRRGESKRDRTETASASVRPAARLGFAAKDEVPAREHTLSVSDAGAHTSVILNGARPPRAVGYRRAITAVAVAALGGAIGVSLLRAHPQESALVLPAPPAAGSALAAAERAPSLAAPTASESGSPRAPTTTTPPAVATATVTAEAQSGRPEATLSAPKPVASQARPIRKASRPARKPYRPDLP